MTMNQHLLKMHVTGESTRSDRALTQLRELCDPTVVRHLRAPMRRVIGDLADQGKVILGLDLRPLAGNAGRPQHAGIAESKTTDGIYGF